MGESAFLQFKSFSIKIEGLTGSTLLMDFFNEFSAFECQALINPDLVLQAQPDGLHLHWHQEGLKALEFYVDVLKVVKQLRSFPAPKQGAFNQALGKKTKHVIDATGGWGGDALLMCTQGYQVTVLERNPLMALMLRDAMRRLSASSWALDNQVLTPSVINIDSVDYFLNNKVPDNVECIYLDPMFPPKKKKKAAVNKQMQLLQWMVGQDLDASQLLENALSAGGSRIVVKRPDHAQALFCKPSNQFSSKLVHYDVYLAD